MEQPDEHYSLVGGNLVITNPIQKKHAGTYICVAKNIYGTVISKEARLKFGCEHVIDCIKDGCKLVRERKYVLFQKFYESGE